MKPDPLTRAPRWALVFGGGAARGIAHAGVIKVLQEEGLRPDFVVGSSAGAMAGAFMAAGLSAARVASWGASLTWGMMTRPVMNRLGLLSNDRVAGLLERALPVRTFDELELPFACMATDLSTSEPVLLCEGDLATAIQASCAIPGLIVPVNRDGRMLIDGGVSGNVPTRVARLLGADLIVAVDVNRSFRRAQAPDNVLSILMQSYFTVGRLADQGFTENADLVIMPDVGDVGFDQLQRGWELVAAGERAARRILPELKLLLGARISLAPPVRAEAA